MKTLRIATRRSALALRQARGVAERLRALTPNVDVELLEVVTEGDRNQRDSLATVGGKGLFIKALEEAIASGRADLAVHSMKDVPGVLPEGFALTTFGARADPRDALLTRGDVNGASAGQGFAALPRPARIGTSSTRRGALLKSIDQGIGIVPLRGNVDTRLRKLDEGDLDAIVLACAGLDRLDMGTRIAERMAPELMVPAPGQGALAIEYLEGQEELRGLLEPGIDGLVDACVMAERAVTAGLGGDCTMPLGVHCTPVDGQFRLIAVLLTPDGARQIRTEVQDAEPLRAAERTRQRLLDLGAAELLDA